jgi:ABC-type transport system involved in multi-copper enzyme maturation permease subunit
VTRAVWENPIVRRELHGFGHRLRDWRLWIGLRLPREPREWGLPAITWFALAPYIQWVLLLALGRFSPSLLQYAGPGDIFALFLLGLGFYACAVATVIGATTITREREQVTWEQVAVTPMTTAELVLGYWLARALPLVLGVLVSLSVWVLLYPHYMPLLERFGPVDLSQKELLFFGLWLMVDILSWNGLGLMFSTLCRSSAVATVAAVVCLIVIQVSTTVDFLDPPIYRRPPYTVALTIHAALGGLALLVAGIRLEAIRRTGPGVRRSKRTEATW